MVNKGEKYLNETMELLLERASCRSFSDTKIPEHVLNQILEAATRAPSGGNLQPFSVVLIEKDETRKKLAEMCGQAFIADAPVNLLFCLDWHRMKRWAELEAAPFTATDSFRHFWISFQDTIISAQNVCTAADSLGLGSVYIGTVIDYIFEIRDMFQLPEEVVPVVLLCIGYPKNRPSVAKKLPVDVIIHRENYWKPTDEEIQESFREKYDARIIPLTTERLDLLKEVCLKVGGEEFHQTCLRRVQEQGYFNYAQYYFILRYRADIMPVGNEIFLGFFREKGFGWFDPCKLPS